METERFFAHSAATREAWEPLHEHLAAVAERAARLATPFGAAEAARVCGLLHDLGKYSPLFTRRLENREHGLDHWSAGAWEALRRYRQAGVAAALAIQGHHIGLQRGDNLSLRSLRPATLATQHPLGLRLTETDPDALLGRFTADGLELPPLAEPLSHSGTPKVAAMLDVRMLFSALTDADFVETEAHFAREPDRRKRYRLHGPELEPDRALAFLNDKLAELARGSQAEIEVRRLRADLLGACRGAAELPTGLFTLTAPTGGGKTLSMLAFALRHAQHHGLRRIVVAIPFLTIIEQTAKVYRELFEPHFGPYYLLEHHSLAGLRKEKGEGLDADHEAEARRTARLLSENWDAPLVVTTSVQLLESLFSNRPGACRKLHRLAGSVLLFDEVQTLPLPLAVPTLAALSRLAERYGSTVVFSTATQPAFDHLDGEVRRHATSGWAPRELVPERLGLFKRVMRTRVLWEHEQRVSWNGLAERLASHEQVLCVVNLKRHALALARALLDRGAAVFHLSTNLCPAHREKVLAEVRERLEGGAPCRLVSTQCVEAGVDVDFPAVFRAFGPLDAIAQAAGRCNRNGKNPRGGEVTVFRPLVEEEGYPPGGYAQAAKVTASLLGTHASAGLDLDDPATFRIYYEALYDLGRAHEAEVGRARSLEAAVTALDYAKVAEAYRLIDNDAVEVLVPWEPARFGELRRRLEEEGRLTRGWVREARRHAVSLFRPKPSDEIWNVLEPAPLARGERSQDWFVLLEETAYDRNLLGLVGAEDSWIA